MGALLTIFILAIGPFIQQVIVFENHEVIAGNASHPISHYYGIFSETAGPDLGMLAAVYTGGLNSQANDVSVTPSCSTGNCTWPNYASLAVCSACANLTAELRESSLNFTVPNASNTFIQSSFSLPNGFGLSGIFDNLYPTSDYPLSLMNATTTYSGDRTPAVDTMAFPNRGNVLMDGFLITKPPDVQTLFPLGPPLAFECIVHFCVQTYHATVTNGIFSETVIAELGLNGTTFMGPENINSYPSPFNKQDFTVGANTILGLTSWFNTSFTGNAWNGEKGWSFSSVMLESLFQSVTGFEPDSAGTTTSRSTRKFDPTTLFEDIARSMTVRVRTTYFSPFANDPDVFGPPTAVGVAFRTLIHSHVEWAWIILPAILELLGLAFFVLVVRNSRMSGVGPYKSGLLPVLFHGIEGRAREKMPALDDIDMMKDHAGRTYVRLESFGDAGWRLVPVE